MKIPVRMIGLATTFFWLFLIAFFASAVYSVKDVRFDFGQPQINMTSDNKVIVCLPISIDNVGYYNIGSFNMTTEISDHEGFLITQGSTFIPVIEKGRRVMATHNVTINITDLQDIQGYLFDDKELKVYEKVSMKLAEVIPVQASTNVSTCWGAPLYNFTLGEIEYMTYNLTHTTATVSINFENHASFDLTGSIQIRMYNSTNILICQGQTTIEALQNVPYQGHVELNVPLAEITDDGYFEVYFLTPIFEFGPLVIPYD